MALGVGRFPVTQVSAEARIALQPRRYGKAKAVVGKPAFATDAKGLCQPPVITMRERFFIAAPPPQKNATEPSLAGFFLKGSEKSHPKRAFFPKLRKRVN